VRFAHFELINFEFYNSQLEKSKSQAKPRTIQNSKFKNQKSLL